jgi:hypothetical protein
MYLLNKKLFLAIIIILLSFVLSGCLIKNSPTVTPTEPVWPKTTQHEPTITPKAKGDVLMSPITLTYAVDNPLTFDYHDYDKGINIGNYFTISGLKDKVVQKKINDAIFELYKSYLPYAEGTLTPPYRGYLAYDDAYTDTLSTELYIAPEYNSNHVLSVSLRLFVQKKVNGKYTKLLNGTFSLMDGLTFDLNTGELIHLEDLFTNDVDAYAYINDAIVDEVRRRSLHESSFFYWYPLELVAPFKGIKDNQKFYLAYDSLLPIIDYSNPEFDVHFNATTLDIPFGTSEGCFAITQRFYNKKADLFESKPTFYRLFNAYHLVRTSENTNTVIDDITYTINYNLLEGMDPVLIEAIKSHAWSYISTETAATQLDLSVWTQKFGPYTTASYEFYVPLETHAAWRRSEQVYNEAHELVSLSDLFVQGFDYETFLVDYLSRRDATISNHKFSDLMFTLSDTQINLVSLSYVHEEGDAYPDHYYIPYSDIGIENLTLFLN